MDLWREFHGPNAAYVLDLYDQYLRDPASVDEATRSYFKNWQPPAAATVSAPAAPPAVRPASADLQKAAGAAMLAESIRRYGHFAAHLDPLDSPPQGDPALELATYGLAEADLAALPASLVGGPPAQGAANALEAIRALRNIYSSRVGFDFLQIRTPEEREWLREAVESGRFSVQQQPIDPAALLRRLTQVETFEHFLQRSFVAKTRFSIEGLDMLVPLLDEVIGESAEAGITSILIGMAHRGRLNVLAHVLEKPIDQILAEFRDPLRRRLLQNEPTGWMGDVKYHSGAKHRLAAANGKPSDDGWRGAKQSGNKLPQTIPAENTEINLTVAMAPNPSHLEAVNPVVQGMARAAGSEVNHPGPARFNPGVTLPILIHGDAAFPGEGVVAETLNLYNLPGYWTGGSIHIIANNQIGFTTQPDELRSTLFASDLAKGFRIPIIHINADDPEDCIMAARIAFAFRQRFQRDFLLDLIGYRRLGHNEGDEPAFTQPVLYEQIRAHPSVRQIWADHLTRLKQVTSEQAQSIYDQQMAELQTSLENLDPEALQEPIPAAPPPGAARKVETAVPLSELRQLNADLTHLPENFNLHPRLARIRSRRDKMFDDPHWPSVDWATGEELAMATILAEGIPIRLTGQDVERGTFSHRHAVLHDAQTGAVYTPLQSIPQAKAAFSVYNSPLSEMAALGFEFGYDIQSLDQLVIWEAQYGDFVNNAQTMVDEFVASARDKWGQLPSLVLLLPHGYEGQGPDHSSGRLERFLSLAVDNNLRVANCTTAAQFFHLLRRQALLLERDPLPLAVMTPKSLLRHPLVSSAPLEFSEGRFQPIIDRRAPPDQPLPPADQVNRLILCSGKVYVDLVTSEIQPQHPQVGVARIEQLAPFPLDDLQNLLSGYPALQVLLWVQEEPENMGAWPYARGYLEQAASGCGVPLRLISRPAASSPAEGSNNLHTFNQQKLVERSFTEEINQPARK